MSWSSNKNILFFLVAIYGAYSFYVYTSGTVTFSDIPDPARKGREIFQSKNCIACHQIYGLGGYMGPDLTNTISRRGSDFVTTYLENGTDRMPDFELSEYEIASLVSYLTYLDSTAVYPVKAYEISWYGFVNRKVNFVK